MSINLMNLVKDQISGDMLSQLGGLLGEDATATEKGLNAALPSLLGGLMNGVSGPNLDGASSLLNLIKTDKHDGGLLNNLSGLFSGGEQTNSLLKTGTGLLSSLFFGNRSNSMFDLIGRVAGFKNSRSSSSILGMLAPILLNFVGKRVMSGGLDALGLKKLLLGQKDAVKAAAPAGLASALGISSFDGFTDSLKNIAGGTVDAGQKVVGNTMNAGKKVVGGTADAGRKIVGGTADAGRKIAGGTADVAKSGGGLLKKLLPLLVLLAAGIIAWPLLRGCGGQAMDATKDVANKTVQTTKNAAGAVADGTKNAVNKVADGTKNAAGAVGTAAGNAASGAANAVKDAVKKGADFFKFAPNSTEAKFADFLTNPKSNLNQSFVLDKVFFETGSATLKPQSKSQLNNIVKVMKGYPKVQIQTQGHTDNVGNAASNKKLSQQRADAVKVYLQQQGVPANRMSALGFGDVKPRAKNDTPANKAKNRRTEIKVTRR